MTYVTSAILTAGVIQGSIYGSAILGVGIIQGFIYGSAI